MIVAGVREIPRALVYSCGDVDPDVGGLACKRGCGRSVPDGGSGPRRPAPSRADPAPPPSEWACPSPAGWPPHGHQLPRWHGGGGGGRVSRPTGWCGCDSGPFGGPAGGATEAAQLPRVRGPPAGPAGWAAATAGGHGGAAVQAGAGWWRRCRRPSQRQRRGARPRERRRRTGGGWWPTTRQARRAGGGPRRAGGAPDPGGGGGGRIGGSGPAGRGRRSSGEAARRGGRRGRAGRRGPGGERRGSGASLGASSAGGKPRCRVRLPTAWSTALGRCGHAQEATPGLGRPSRDNGWCTRTAPHTLASHGHRPRPTSAGGSPAAVHPSAVPTLTRLWAARRVVRTAGPWSAAGALLPAVTELHPWGDGALQTAVARGAPSAWRGAAPSPWPVSWRSRPGSGSRAWGAPSRTRP